MCLGFCGEFQGHQLTFQWARLVFPCRVLLVPGGGEKRCESATAVFSSSHALKVCNPVQRPIPKVGNRQLYLHTYSLLKCITSCNDEVGL